MREPAVRYPRVQSAVGIQVTAHTLPPPGEGRLLEGRLLEGRVHKGRPRAGVTLLELLIVLVLLAVTASVVLPALRPPAKAPEDRIDALVRSARHAALRRAEPVRLRLDTDGAWAVVGARTGGIIDTGRLPVRAQRLDLNVDARGSCAPAGAQAVASANGLSFDPLACRTRSDARSDARSEPRADSAR